MAGRVPQEYVLDNAIKQIIDSFVITTDDIRDITLESGEYMLNDTLYGDPMVEVIRNAPNSGSFIGHIFPMAFRKIFIPRYPKIFRPEQGPYEKDIVCLIDPSNSFEIKASTSVDDIRGNNSYAWGELEKDKSSYYLSVNFNPDSYVIDMIRFGWLDIEDWTKTLSGQGQGSTVKVKPRRTKMQKLYERHISI